MKVKARNWINVDGIWHQAGETFEIDDIAGIEESVEVIAEPESKKPKVEPEQQETPVEAAPKRRGRPRQ